MLSNPSVERSRFARRVWLIGVSMFQRGLASVDFRRIALLQGDRTHFIFPD